jgi:trehalose 6-phosphate phosphatase
VTISLSGDPAPGRRLTHCPKPQRPEVHLSSIIESTALVRSPRRDAPDLPWCLFLDVDGTLLEIAATPDTVSVDDHLRQLLSEVSHALDGAVALVSGRAIAALDQLFAPQRWPAAGLHGIERRDARGGLHRHAPARLRLDEARLQLLYLAARTPGILLEDKGAAIAVHYRAVPEIEPKLRRVLGAVVARLAPDYHLLEGKQVFELKPAFATKADAVQAFMREAPFAGRRPIYVGDDVTDLDGFAAVERVGGLSVAVGDRVQAQLRVASPRDVRALLADLSELRSPAP